MHANHNSLLGSYSGLDGIKTGYTSSSGFNLVASAVRDGRRFIGVVLGARSPANRGVVMASLLDQAFGGGDIMEAQQQAPVPAQVQLAGASPSETEIAATVATRSASTARTFRAVRTEKVSTRSRVRMARGQKQPSKQTIVKLASLSKATAAGRRDVASQKQSAAGRARTATTVTAMRGKPAMAARLASRSQLKMPDLSRKPAAARMVKVSSIVDKSKIRVAEGGRKRSS